MDILRDTSDYTKEDYQRMGFVFIFSFIGFWICNQMSSTVLEKQEHNKIY